MQEKPTHDHARWNELAFYSFGAVDIRVMMQESQQLEAPVPGRATNCAHVVLKRDGYANGKTSAAAAGPSYFGRSRRASTG